MKCRAAGRKTVRITPSSSDHNTNSGQGCGGAVGRADQSHRGLIKGMRNFLPKAVSGPGENQALPGHPTSKRRAVYKNSSRLRRMHSQLVGEIWNVLLVNGGNICSGPRARRTCILDPLLSYCTNGRTLFSLLPFSSRDFWVC